MSASERVIPDAFRRDSPTLLSYGALGAYAFCLYAFGPALALLRAQLHFSYTMLSVNTSLWAGGAALVGVSFAGASRRFGRRRVLWCSVLATAVGTALFATAQTLAMVLISAAMLGFAGTMVQTATQAILSDRHGPRRDRALVESNIGAGIAAVLAPAALGLFSATALGWRSAMALPVLVLAALYLRFRQQDLPRPAGSTSTRTTRGRLPRACRRYAWLVAVGIAAEFCVVYFGAELLTHNTGLSTSHAATAMSLFYLGILIGRIAGSALTRSVGRTVSLLWASLGFTVVGILAFWLSGQVDIALLGLFVNGVGVANLFPLSLALSLDAAANHSDAANARSQLLGGLMVVAAPFALGVLADRFGLSTAFAIDPVLVGVCAVLLVAGNRAVRHDAAA